MSRNTGRIILYCALDSLALSTIVWIDAWSTGAAPGRCRKLIGCNFGWLLWPTLFVPCLFLSALVQEIRRRWRIHR